MRQEYERQILKHSTAQSNKSKKDQTALASKYPQGFFKDRPDVLQNAIHYLERATTIEKTS